MDLFPPAQRTAGRRLVIQQDKIESGALIMSLVMVVLPSNCWVRNACFAYRPTGEGEFLGAGVPA